MKKYKWVIIGFLGLLLVGELVLVGFQNKNQSLDINSSFVQDLYLKIVPNKQAFILKQLYDNELSDDYKINIGILSLVGEEDPGTISALEVEQSIKELLGDDATVEHKTIQFFINGVVAIHMMKKIRNIYLLMDVVEYQMNIFIKNC